MTLKNLYQYWFIALIISVVIALVYTYIGTSMYIATLGPYESRDFAALPYLIHGHTIGSVCTGVITASLIAIRKGIDGNRRLVTWLIVLYVLVGALMYGVPFLFFVNPIGFLVFASIPCLSWMFVYPRSFPRVLGAIVALAVITTAFYALVMTATLRL